MQDESNHVDGLMEPFPLMQPLLPYIKELICRQVSNIQQSFTNLVQKLIQQSNGTTLLIHQTQDCVEWL
jgi:hypothetical protein